MKDKVREAIIAGDVGGAAKAFVESKATGHDVEPIILRPEVLKFAEAMERNLVENEHKGDWNGCETAYLLPRSRQDFAEFEECVDHGVSCLDEAADVANFLMMVCDVLGELSG